MEHFLSSCIEWHPGIFLSLCQAITFGHIVKNIGLVTPVNWFPWRTKSLTEHSGWIQVEAVSADIKRCLLERKQHLPPGGNYWIIHGNKLHKISHSSSPRGCHSTSSWKDSSNQHSPTKKQTSRLLPILHFEGGEKTAQPECTLYVSKPDSNTLCIYWLWRDKNSVTGIIHCFGTMTCRAWSHSWHPFLCVTPSARSLLIMTHTTSRQLGDAEY